jgi:hypothetical protein
MLGRSSLTRSRLAFFILVVAVAGACTSDDVTAPPGADEGAMTVDASTGWVYVSLSDSAVVTPTPHATASTDWDIAFNATNVMLNGGEAGPGGVTGACICQNASATDAQVLAMTPASELAEFESLTSVPAGVSFSGEDFVPAFDGWYAGSGPTATASADEVFLLRLADGTSFAKVHVTALQSPTLTAPGTITLEYAIQSDETAAFGATQTLDIDATAGVTQVDLNTGTSGASVTGWDLEIEGYTIRLNGGVSGTGATGAAAATEPFAQVTSAAMHASAYRADTYAGVFNDSRWYRYNLAGDNRISPTFDIYVIKRGSLTYALQIVNYYSATDQPRRISFRFGASEGDQHAPDEVAGTRARHAAGGRLSGGAGDGQHHGSRAGRRLRRPARVRGSPSG